MDVKTKPGGCSPSPSRQAPAKPPPTPPRSQDDAFEKILLGGSQTRAWAPNFQRKSGGKSCVLSEWGRQNQHRTAHAGSSTRNMISHIFFVKGTCFFENARLPFFPRNVSSKIPDHPWNEVSDHLWHDSREGRNVVKFMHTVHMWQQNALAENTQGKSALENNRRLSGQLGCQAPA